MNPVVPNRQSPFEVLSTIPIGVFVLNADYQVLFWNECLENWTGIPGAAVVGTDVRKILPSLTEPARMRRMADVFQRGVPTVFSPQFHKPLIPCEIRPGVQRVQNVTVTSIPDNERGGYLAVVSIQDSTDLTRRLQESRTAQQRLAAELEQRAALEQDLYSAKNAAEEASRSKSQFLAVMSHEMRTPLNGVLGTVELLLLTGLNSEQRELAEIMQNSGGLLLSLINDTLDLAKIEAGRLTLEQLEFDIRAIVEECIRLVLRQAEHKNLQLHWEVAKNVPGLLVGDPTRLQQILLNLLGNALKFTASGGVRLRVKVDPGQSGPANLLFEVIDTGIGISEQAQASLFRPFVQADASTTRRFGGTGLGLAVCKRLTEMMGGDIGVESKLGEGSRFWFTARFRPVESASVSAGSPILRTCSRMSGADRPRLLVAEDNPVNQRVVVKMLEKLGYHAETVCNGLQAVAAVERSHYDAVLMDCSMPEMDGYQATAAIRRMEGNRSHTPIVAITAHAYADAREASAASGMDDYVSKPIQMSRLAEVLERVLAEADWPHTPEIPADAELQSTCSGSPGLR
ncbi:MAG: ATP-binding protein [Paludibaculum sp.]